MQCQVVFNLFPFSETLFLPSANIVQTDAGGHLTHLVQKATPATIGSYGIALTPQLESLFRIVDTLAPKNLEAKFKPPKARTITPLPGLLADTAAKSVVEGFISREMDRLLGELARNRIPLTLDAERRTLAKDVQISYGTESLLPYLAFRQTDAGIEYRLRLGTESENWSIREHEIVPLTNTDPAWLLVGYALFRIPGINGNMVRPFRNKDVIQIPPAKTRQYFQSFIAKAARKAHIEAEGFAVQETAQLLQTRLEIQENVLENHWYFKPVFVYDGAEFPYGDRRDRVTSVEFPADGEPVLVRRILRRPDAERAALDTLEALGLHADGRCFLPSEQTAAGLESCLFWLSGALAALQEAGIEPVAPEYQGKTLAIAAGAIDVRSEVRDDWFDVHGQVRVGAHNFPFKALAPYLRRGDRLFPLPDGQYFLLPEAWFARYAELAQSAEDGAGDQLRLRKSLFTVLESADMDTDTASFPIIDPDAVEYRQSDDLKAVLRPYQLRGVKWLVGHYRHGFGACLADDMGLGKTVQTIALLLYAKNARFADGNQEIMASGAGPQLDLFQTYRSELRPLNALLILPASLIFNWQQELSRFAPNLFVYVHTGPKRLKDHRAMAGYDVVLTTYHTARQDLALLEKTAWHVMVLDESQQIKNRDSDISKVVRRLHGQCKISLSGTPIENSLADLWTQMEFINPSTLGPYTVFRERFQVPIEKQADQAARERLFARVKPFFMRRTKEEVAPELPPLTEQVFYTEMAEEQERRYEQVKSAVRNEILSLFDDPKTRVQALQALTRLRQLANHPVLTDAEYEGSSGKFEDVMAQWEVARKSGHKVLFFSSFEKHLRLFRRVFEAQGYPFAWLTGDTPQAERALEVRRFQEEASVQAFFMTLKAGGVGLNLTAADYVFMLDPWWNPAAEAQAIARAHRIGRERPVTAMRFISRGTIEEKMLVVQARKVQLGQQLFASGEETPALTRADMESLLS